MSNKFNIGARNYHKYFQRGIFISIRNESKCRAYDCTFRWSNICLLENLIKKLKENILSNFQFRAIKMENHRKSLDWQKHKCHKEIFK